MKITVWTLVPFYELALFILRLLSQVQEDTRLFVLEIGTEEMPPQDVVNASQQVCRLFYNEKNESVS